MVLRDLHLKNFQSFNQAKSETGFWFCSTTVNNIVQGPEPPESRVQSPASNSCVQSPGIPVCQLFWGAVLIKNLPNSTMSVMLCTGANFEKKNSCLVGKEVSFYTVGLHLLTFLILEPLLSRYILTWMVLWYYYSTIWINTSKSPSC